MESKPDLGFCSLAPHWIISSTAEHEPNCTNKGQIVQVPTSPLPKVVRFREITLNINKNHWLYKWSYFVSIFMHLWQKHFVKSRARQFYLKTVGWETKAVTHCQKILLSYPTSMTQAELWLSTQTPWLSLKWENKVCRSSYVGSSYLTISYQ